MLVGRYKFHAITLEKSDAVVLFYDNQNISWFAKSDDSAWLNLRFLFHFLAGARVLILIRRIIFFLLSSLFYILWGFLKEMLIINFSAIWHIVRQGEPKWKSADVTSKGIGRNVIAWRFFYFISQLIKMWFSVHFQKRKVIQSMHLAHVMERHKIEMIFVRNIWKWDEQKLANHSYMKWE